MNKIADVSIARTPHRLNNTNDDIISRGIYLSIVDVVVDGGDADGDHDEVGDDSARLRLSMSCGSEERYH